MIPVNVRLPEALVKPIDKWVDEGRFASRSDAVKTMIALYEEKEKTRRFLEMLNSESEYADKHPEKLVSIEDI